MRGLRDVVAEAARSVERVARGVVRRAVLRLDSRLAGAVLAQVEATRGDVDPEAEVWFPYGFASRPLRGAEALALAVGGDPGHVVLLVADRRYLPTGIAAGEVWLRDDQGRYVAILRTRVEVEGSEIRIGAGATAGAARTGDAIVVSQAAFLVWMTAVDVAIAAASAQLVALGQAGLVPTANPGAPTGTITGGSSSVRVKN